MDGSDDGRNEDIRRPLLIPRGGTGDGDGDGSDHRVNNSNDSGINDTTGESDNLLREWNDSVAAFVAENGGEENLNCYCDGSIDDDPSEEEHDGANGESTGDDDDDSDEHSWTEEENRRHRNNRWDALSKIICTTLIPDCCEEETTHHGNISHSVGDGSRDGNNNSDHGNRERKSPKLVEGTGVVKFSKFLLLTLGSIALVRTTVVALGISDRDSSLTLSQVFVYEGDSIVRDAVVFFVIGRMQAHERTGVDTLEWAFWGLLANLYFESQAFVPWMQHSATPYEMHCLWPWQLWVLAGFVVLSAAGLFAAHAVVAHRRGWLWIRAFELAGCFGVFVVPVLSSPYAHFHHWFAGWFLGMHASLHDHWWSRAAMAYSWGTYVNGIAVYGRDPLLTCAYARFVATDQNCPGLSPVVADAATIVEALPPPDWRNCSGSGYHP